MKHILTLLLLLFSTLLAFGQSQETYELNGTVVDQSGQPLEGVTVSLTCDTLDYKTVTDDNGTRNVISNQQCAKVDEGTTVEITGTGEGKIVVIFDNETVYTQDVDFAEGAI